MTDHLMELTTTVAPAKTFGIDGEAYELLGMDHLSPQSEAVVMGAFSRYGTMAKQLEDAKTEEIATKVAFAMRDLRLKILSNLTSCPTDVLAKLPMSGQVTLMNALRDELAEGDDETGAEE